jgi:hypothetical protein
MQQVAAGLAYLPPDVIFPDQGSFPRMMLLSAENTSMTSLSKTYLMVFQGLLLISMTAFCTCSQHKLSSSC